jgi:hypothetical protein
MGLVDSLLGSDDKFDAQKGIEDATAKYEADLKNTLGRWMRTDEGMFFLKWMENIIDARVYAPGLALEDTAFSEGTRYIAMEILRVAGIKGDK